MISIIYKEVKAEWKDDIGISVGQWVLLLNDRTIFREDDLELLKLIFNCEGHMATASQLARILNIPHHAPLNSQIGRLGQRIVKSLEIEPPKQKVGKGYNWFNVPFWGIETELGYHWILRPELKTAMDTLDQCELALEKIEYFAGDDIVTQLHEGAKVQAYVNRYERNPVARRKCLEYHGTTCVICEFDFGKVYGPVGNGFIHVHHIVPLSDTGSTYEVNFVNDLKPVCPNCHAILHQKNPPFSIAEVKQMISDMK